MPEYLPFNFVIYLQSSHSMKYFYWFFLPLILTGISNVFAQKSSDYYFDQPFLTDSATTLLIPIGYDEPLFTSNKLASWGYYANIIFYNFTTDTQKRLFDKNTYILSFSRQNYSHSNSKTSLYNLTKQHIFYQIRNIDSNNNQKIDDEDSAILYVSDTKGNNLKALSSQEENVVGFTLYEKQNFALVKIQKDMNNDHNFNSKDKEYYLVKLDLTTLAFGNKIELK